MGIKTLEIDKDLARSMATPVLREGETLLMYDVKQKPFKIHGLLAEEDGFARMPKEAALAVNEGIYNLSKATAGGRVRFSTDSEKIVVKVKLDGCQPMGHMSPVGIFGFDIYGVSDGKEEFGGIFAPPTGGETEYEREINFADKKQRDITINFPLYNGVKALEVGILDGSTLKEAAAYSIDKPVLFYGSSITQGACASRPGKCYQSILSRELDMDYINLGFSGSAKGEETMLDYMKSLNVSAFVCDYDYNAPTVEHLRETHFRCYEAIRAAKPDLPIILVSRPNFRHELYEDVLRRSAVMETYVKGINNGDKNLHFVDGAAIFAEVNRMDCTLDCCHPNDVGFYHMAKHIGDVLRFIFKK